MLGPVSNAAHSAPTIGGALFPIVIALPCWSMYGGDF
jgi:hypothetical protein